MAAALLRTAVLFSDWDGIGHYECGARGAFPGIRLGWHGAYFQHERGGAAECGCGFRGRTGECAAVGQAPLLCMGRHLCGRFAGDGVRAGDERVHRGHGSRERRLFCLGVQYRAHPHHQLVPGEEGPGSGVRVHGPFAGIGQSHDLSLGLRALGCAVGHDALCVAGRCGAGVSRPRYQRPPRGARSGPRHVGAPGEDGLPEPGFSHARWLWAFN